MMLYSCTHMPTVGVKGLSRLNVKPFYGTVMVYIVFCVRVQPGSSTNSNMFAFNLLPFFQDTVRILFLRHKTLLG